MKRTLIISFGVLVVLLLASGLMVRRYLHSARISKQVTTKLEALYGGSVQVGEVDVGLKSTSLKDLAFFEEGADEKASQPWLKIASLTADVTLWELASGNAMPESVTVNGAILLFRFDRAGNLLTRFPVQPATGPESEGFQLKPESIPKADIENGEIIFRKEGYPDLIVKNLRAKLSATKSGGIALEGSGTNPEIGKMILSGALEKDASQAVVHVESEKKAHVTQALLDRIPFMPASLWEEVQVAEGDSPAKLTVTYDLNKKTYHYHVDLAPEKATVVIPAVDLSAHNVSGKLTIDDNKAVLRDVQGEAYGGTIHLDGNVEVGSALSAIRVTHLKVANLNLQELPEQWNIPAVVRKTVGKGKLFGTASLELDILPSHLTPLYASTILALSGVPNGFGTNQWFPSVALLTAYPGHDVRFKSQGKAQVRDPDGKVEPIDFDWKPAPKRSDSRKTLPAVSLERSTIGSHGIVAGVGTPTPEFPCLIRSRPVDCGDVYAETQDVALAGSPGSEYRPRPRSSLVLPANEASELLSAFPRPLIPSVKRDWQAALNFNAKSLEPALSSEKAERLLASEVVRNALLFLVDVKGAAESVALSVQAQKDKELKSTTNYLDMNLNLKNVNLEEFVKNLGVKIPFAVNGKVSFHIKASIPMDNPNELKAYKVVGTVQVTQFQMAGIHMNEVNADVNYDQGFLYLKSLKGRIAPEKAGEKDAGGTLQGSGQLQLFPLGEMNADLTLDRIPVGELAGLGTDKVQGTFSGKIKVRAPAEKLQGVEGLVADGTITSTQIKAYGMSVENVSTKIQLKDGVLKLTALKANVEGTPINATGELKLKDDYPFQVKLDLKDWNLASLQKVAAIEKAPSITLGGAFTTSVGLSGKLNPFQFAVAGDAQAKDLKFERFELQDISFHWASDGKELALTNVDAKMYGGEALGNAVVPIDAAALGSIDLRVRNLNVAKLAQDLKMPFRIEGKVDGSIKGTFPAVKDGKPRIASMDLVIKAPKMRVQNIPTEQLQGKLDYQNGVLDYKLEGKTLGGSFDLEGQIPSKEKAVAPKKGAAKKGHLIIRNIRLSRLFDALNAANPEAISGILNLKLPFTHETPDGMPQGEGTLRITNLRYKDRLLADEIRGNISVSEKHLRLSDFGGSLDQGTIDAKATYYFVQPERSWFALNFERVNAAYLLGPWLDGKVEGAVQARIHGRLGSEWHGSADIAMDRGKLYGVEVLQLRLPLSWSYSPSQNRAQLNVYDSSAQLARGRATGKMTLTLERAARVEGKVHFERVDVKSLLRETVGHSQLGGGQLKGNFEFYGSEVRSINDLNGALRASFDQAQPLQIPVLSQVAPFLGVSTSATYQKGDVRARLDRGTLRIQEMTLVGTNQQIYIAGSAALTGRLNLAVIAKTGDIGLPTVRLGPIGLRLPAFGPLPLVVVQEASNLLSNRVIYLQVTGTVNSPVIRPRPVPLLSQGAIRFFLDRSNLPITFNP